MQDLVDQLTELILGKNLKLGTAESCTGGLLAATIIRKSGASEIYDRGFITYSNEAKTEMLGVPADMIERHGAVSAEVAEAMAKGVIENSASDLSVSITGVAGPDGGTEEKPVGTVFIGHALRSGAVESQKYHFEGPREKVQNQTVKEALSHMIKIVEAADE